jgi:hypothetical protein
MPRRVRVAALREEGKLRGEVGEFRHKAAIGQEKKNYHKNHNIKEKINGFELHHVVALEYADSPAMYKLLDDWRNMVYIDGHSHAKITQNKNRNIVMESNISDLILKDYSSHKVYLRYLENIAYDTPKQSMMIEYNNELRKTLQPEI